MSLKKIEKNTKKIFSKIHPKQFKDKKIFERLNILLSHSFFNVKKNFFKKKVCLDAASGINLNATYSENIELLSVEQTSANVIIILDEESLTIVHPNFKENFEYKITSAAPTSHVGELNIKGESSIWVHLSNGIVEISDNPAN